MWRGQRIGIEAIYVIDSFEAQIWVTLLTPH